MPGREICNKASEMKGLTIQQHLFENVGVCQTMANRIWEDQQSSDFKLSCMSACKIFFIVELLHWVRELYRRISAQNQLN
eukprot:885585-Pelagomonas_calceolata.AAC.1